MRRIALFVTCFNDTLFPKTGRAVVEVLERLGHAVEFPEAQTCCGQMHINTGYAAEALPLVRRFVKIFEDAEHIVTPSASCAATVRELYPQVAERAGDAGLRNAVEELGPHVYEFSELLVDVLDIEEVGAYFPHRVVYHPTCHSLRLLNVGTAPTRLLAAVRGLQLVELPQADECCGFGGTFAVKNAEVSSAMALEKIGAILDSGAEVCAAADNSCLMHLGGALRRWHAGIRTMHLAEILAHTEAAT